MPQRRSRPGGRGQFRTVVQKLDNEDHGSVERNPSDGADLAARLVRVAGSPLDQIDPTDSLLIDWNRSLEGSTHSGFEYRLLLGLGINARRPSYGQVSGYIANTAGSLAQSTRWVYETIRVATVVYSAIEQGIVIPLAIRDVAWRSVPSAVDNIRAGRALDWTEPKDDTAATLEQLQAKATKALEALVKALEAIEDDDSRVALVALGSRQALGLGSGRDRRALRRPARPRAGPGLARSGHLPAWSLSSVRLDPRLLRPARARALAGRELHRAGPVFGAGGLVARPSHRALG